MSFGGPRALVPGAEPHDRRSSAPVARARGFVHDRETSVADRCASSAPSGTRDRRTNVLFARSPASVGDEARFVADKRASSAPSGTSERRRDALFARSPAERVNESEKVEFEIY